MFERLNLQMFADPNVQTTGSSGLSAEMKTFYDKRLLDNAEPVLVHNQFGQKRPIPEKNGKVIEFRRFSSLTKNTTALQEGVVPNGSNIAVSAITAQIAQYGDYVTLSDVLDMTAIDNVVLEATAELASQAARTLDTLTRDVIDAGTQRIFAPYLSGGNLVAVTDRTEVTAACLLTLNVIFKAAAELKAMNAPMVDGSYVAFIHPYVAYDLMQSSSWLDVQKYATPDKIFNGEIGKLGNVRFIETTEAKIIAPGAMCGILANRMALHTALDSNGSVDVKPKTAISTTDAAAINAAISAGATYQIYVGGTLATLASVTAGAVGTAKFTATAAVKSKTEDAVICGTGAGADGSAVFCTLVLGNKPYGVIEVAGGGLRHFVKAAGSAGTADPLDQMSTVGWKAIHVAKRLTEEYMMRIESGSSYSATAQTN